MVSAASQNFTENPSSDWWSGNRIKAVQHVAEDRLTDEQIAEQVGVTRRTLAEWKKHPEFEERRKALVAELGERARQAGLGRLDVRMDRYKRRAEALDLVVAERADDPTMQNIPGGRSGYLVRTIKSITIEYEPDPEDPDAKPRRGQRQIEEYAVDTGLLREQRELEKQAAQDAGQWSEKREISGPDGGSVPILAIEVPRPPEDDD